MDGWLGAAAALAGVAIGALADGLRSRAAFWRERRWDHRRETALRLEDLFTALEEIHHRTSVHVTEAILALAAGKSKLDIEGPVMPYSKVAMIVGLYLPHLASHRDALISARDETAKAILSCVEALNAGKETKDRALVRLRRASKDFEAVCDAFRAAMADAARDHDRLLEGKRL
jgi:hypothetical protein